MFFNSTIQKKHKSTNQQILIKSNKLKKNNNIIPTFNRTVRLNNFTKCTT